MTLSAGSKLGPYEIHSPVGAGGMGEVYRARDTRLGRDVAIKILPEGFTQDTDRLRRFEQEAHVVATLNHPNILAIFDVGKEDGAPYLVTELLEGEPLREKLKSGPLPVRRALEYALGIAHGLAAAHEKGIVHRDLKPENVFVTRDGRVKILDFGLAKLARAEAAAAGATLDSPTIDHATSPGMLLGTVEYMSPEQVRGQPADSRSDIFALGTMLYEMLAGARAFHRETAAETMTAILKEDPPEFTDAAHPVPPGLERIVRRCLEKTPEQRFQSARDLAFALESISGMSSGSVVAPARALGKGRSWRTPAGVVLVAALAVGMYFAGRGMAPRGNSAAAYRQLTYRPQSIFRALFAPDGQTVIFTAADEGTSPTLYTIHPDYPEAKSSGLKGVQLLAVSKKGELALLTHAQFLSHRLFRGTLARMPLGSSAPREILEGVEEADWTPDGSELAIIREVGGKTRLEYPVGTVLYETAAYVSDLRFSPKGDRIAFFDHPGKFDDRGAVSVVEIATKRKTDLAGGFWGMEGLAWSQDGGEVFFSASTGGANYQPRSVTLQGKQRLVLPAAGSLILYDVAPGGRWLVARGDLQHRVVAKDPASGADRDFSWLDFSIGPSISDDGRLIAFSEESSAMGANYAMVLRKTDGSPAVVLGEGIGPVSGDGKWVASVVATTPPKLMLYPTGAGEGHQLEPGLLVGYAGVSWFPDSKRLLVCGNEAGRATRCFAQDIAGGPPKPITPEGIQLAWVSPDAKTVLGLAPDQWKYFLYPIGGGEPRTLPQMTRDMIAIGWSGTDSVLLYRTGQLPLRVEKMDLASGRRTPVRDLSPADRSGVLGISSIAISPDGKSYTYGYPRDVSQLFTVEGVK
ncbi:MAG: protein kinase [Acidobacteriota bacterium]|nr:protein kinase [Acidobacteriota bacterium]